MVFAINLICMLKKIFYNSATTYPLSNFFMTIIDRICILYGNSETIILFPNLRTLEINCPAQSWTIFEWQWQVFLSAAAPNFL